MSDNIAHALAGAAGGIVSMSLTYPLITISTRAQVNKETTHKNAFTAQIEAFKKIVNDEGISGLYSGINSALFGIAITQGVYYYWYEFVKSHLELDVHGKKKNMTTAESMLSGALAGVATSLFTNPIWVINTRQTVKKSSLDDTEKASISKSAAKKSTGMGILGAVRTIFNEEGIAGFWRGILPALVLVINPIIQYTTFEKLKVYREKHKLTMSSLDFFMLGAISKLLATSITYPYIVIKSRMQLKQGSNEDTHYKSTLDGFRKIIKSEGITGLYKGIESKLIQSVLTSAFLFTFKEEFFSFAIRTLILMRLRRK